jgi:hypothetical protein
VCTGVSSNVVRRPRLLPSLVSLFSLAGIVGSMIASSGAAASDSHRSHCFPRGANTIALDRSVRVYTMPEYVGGVRTKRAGTYACLLHRGTTLALKPTRPKPPLPELEHITLAGTIVAFVDFQHGIDSGCDVIEVIDIVRSRIVLVVPEVGCEVDGGFVKNEEATDLVVNEHGTVAWILTRNGFGHPSESIEVHSETTSGSTALLDSGAGIVPGSLRLTPGDEVTWLDAGRQLYAHLS